MAEEYVSFLRSKHTWEKAEGKELPNINYSVISRLLRDLKPFTVGGAFPYKIESYTVLAVPEAEEKVYVLATRFLETDEYDVRIYTPVTRKIWRRYTGCHEWTLNHVCKYRNELKKEGKKVTLSVEPTEYENFPSPPKPNSFVNGEDWEPILNAVLRDRKWSSVNIDDSGRKT